MTYVIVVIREFFGPKTERSLLTDDSDYRAARFPTSKAAKAKIAELDSGRYYLAHNECDRAAYKVSRADRLPVYLRSWL